ncbi:MAG TPA: hypothetical protein VGP08_04735 [Pyrinomonadaceae bacterium]|jgi:hypothetical protein|nr:hypothetical protein [Pyrinomonadaceae bacterium]
MAHDVFISYAVEDRQVADKVCDALAGGSRSLLRWLLRAWEH